MQGQRYVLEAGDLKKMRLVCFDPDLPRPGCVRVAVKVIGLNFADVFAIWGLYCATPKGEFTPGLEFSGTVEAVGAGVNHLKAGDRVMGITRFGAYTTHINLDARYVLPLPAGWDEATGAAFLVQTLTAYYGMVALGQLKRGMTVLIHSAVGGVGLQALQIARAYGCFAIGTVGNAEKRAFVLNRGYDEVLVRGRDFERQLTDALGGRSLELVMDIIGGDYFTLPMKQLAPMGRMVVFGSARYASPGYRPDKLLMLWKFIRRPRVDPQKMIERNTAVLGFNLIWLYERVELMHTLLAELEILHLEPPHVGHRFAFVNMQEAILLFQTGKTIGKVVVEV